MLNILNIKTILEAKNVIRTLIFESEIDDNLKKESDANHDWQKWFLFNSKKMLILTFILSNERNQLKRCNKDQDSKITYYLFISKRLNVKSNHYCDCLSSRCKSNYLKLSVDRFDNNIHYFSNDFLFAFDFFLCENFDFHFIVRRFCCRILDVHLNENWMIIAWNQSFEIIVVFDLNLRHMRNEWKMLSSNRDEFDEKVRCEENSWRNFQERDLRRRKIWENETFEDEHCFVHIYQKIIESCRHRTRRQIDKIQTCNLVES